MRFQINLNLPAGQTVEELYNEVQNGLSQSAILMSGQVTLDPVSNARTLLGKFLFVL